MKGNILGDVRAENDYDMLSKAFYETADYKSLLESSDRCVVVGRRGTGKSALVYRLGKYWETQSKTFVIKVAPEEEQMIGLRGLMGAFGDNYVHVKAGSKLAWRYALYMQVVATMAAHYKAQRDIDIGRIPKHYRDWSSGRSMPTKLRDKLKTVISKDEQPESLIADLSDYLEIALIEDVLRGALSDSNYQFVVLVDRLDEGYTSDSLGVAMIDGFVQAVIDLNSKFSGSIQGVVFLRDNMFRSIAKKDPDFTRNIEGQVLRLHWDDYSLFNLVCNRLRAYHNLTQENNARVWNSYAAKELKNREGFRLALRLTLYRPRDILVLLNNAYLHASGQDRDQIVLLDLEDSARSISNNRLQDLHKEYEAIFPALPLLTSTFYGGDPEFTMAAAKSRLAGELIRDDHDVPIQRGLSFYDDAAQVLQDLYGIGFVGVFDEGAGSYVFSHDGRAPNKEISEHSKFLIHPCYWLALNLSQKTLNADEAEDIFDEYDIEVTSTTEEQRFKKISRLLEELKEIQPGAQGAYAFEDWCFQALRIIFAGLLTNLELHPNKNGLQQRDVVATNMGESSFWRMLFEDYGARQVIFEIKNFAGLGASEYRQMNSYLSGAYGNLGFIICRDNDNNLVKGKDLAWAKELHFEHKKLVIKLSERFLQKHLSKARSPQKHDAADKELAKLLDTYIRRYLITNS